mmetsp:Transcript_2959/g.5181  ORF Transcript_2959/g.5181 Transcript_2959/m.5181 type:complete len:277 (+) Transcript_2959:215-1045(+)
MYTWHLSILSIRAVDSLFISFNALIPSIIIFFTSSNSAYMHTVHHSFTCPSFLLIRTMTIIHRKGNHIPHTLHPTNQHAQPIKSHPPTPMRTTSRLPQIQKPLNGRHIHPPPSNLRIQLVKSPFAHRPPKQFPNARTEQIERQALPAPIICLTHVKRFDFQRPVRHEDERPEFLPVLDVPLALLLRHGHVPEVLYQNLLVLAPQIVVKVGEFLHLDALELSVVSRDLGLVFDELANQFDGIAVLDAHEGTIHALPQEGAGGFHVGGGHATFEEGEV